ncbi:MAG: methionyl-tRNA formyltransferase [Chloroflexota bacterium]|nr:methionyl-tRNA formyltransferase [Chloroflexota bacterium]
MKIAIIGQAAFGKDVLNALVGKKENVAAVLCPPDNPGRPEDPIKSAALENQIPVFQYKRMRDKVAITEFLSLNIDLCVMAFVTDIVPDEILEAPRLGTIQYHPSLLPEHRGPSSINWPIIQGKSKTGLTIFWPDKGLDTGPILLQKEFKITETDTLGSVYFGKLYPAGVEAMVEAVEMVKNGTAPKIEQDHSKATYEGWCRSGDVIIDWNKPGMEIYNLIRGSDPSPGANTMWEQKPIYLFNTSFESSNHDQTPGTVTKISDESFSLSVSGGLINVGRVKLDREAKIMAADFVESPGLKVGDTFGI